MNAEAKTVVLPSAKSQPLPPDVEQLKVEGNALFSRGNYRPAIDKYTAAIEKFKDSPILYANRAACFIGLKRFKEAVEDAQKATELDSSYAKGWGRLGAAQEALNNDAAAQKAYSNALACFPLMDTCLSDADKRLRQQYSRAHMSLRTGKGKLLFMKQGSGWEKRLPWDLAKKLPTQPPYSSARLILAAHAEFETAMTFINGLQMNGGMAFGMTGGLDFLTSAILQDERCFTLSDPEFQTKYNNYITFESIQRGAWMDTLDPAELIRLAKARLARSGWDSVRSALSVTIRAWIMRAFIVRGLAQNTKEALEFYERAIQALELGRREWPNVTTDERGSIFEHTFVRGVRVLHINAYMAAEADHAGRKSPYSLSRLLELADEMLVECATNTRDPNDQYPPEFLNAFEMYPVGTALSMKGFYHVQMAKRGSKTPEEATTHMGMGGKFYLEAAEKFPDDDEYHVWFLYQALDGMFYSGTKVKTILPLMARIRAAAPKMRRIWEYSATALGGRDKALDRILEQEKEVRKGLQEGKFTMEDKVMPELRP